MDPVTMMLISAAISAGGSILSNLLQGNNGYQGTGSPSDVTNVNPYTQEQYNMLMSNMGNWNNQMQQYLNQGQGYGQQQSNLIQQMLNYNPTAQYDTSAGMRQFLAQAPALQGVVQQASGGLGMESYLRDLQNQAMASVNAQLAPELRGSGAYASALSSGLATPLLQIAQAEQNNRSGMLNNLLGQNLNQAYGNEQARFGAAQAADQMALNQLLQGVSGYGNLQGRAMQGAQLFGGLVQGTQGILGGYGAPEYWSPTYTPTPGYMNPQDWMGLALQGLSAYNASTGGVNPSAVDALNPSLQTSPWNFGIG